MPPDKTLLSKPGQVMAGYFFAMIIPVLIALVRLEFLQSLGSNVSYIFFYPAVILVAVFGGFWPGMVATAVSVLLGSYFWIDPVGHFFIVHLVDWLRMIVFVLSCTMISIAFEVWHRKRAPDRNTPVSSEGAPLYIPFKPGISAAMVMIAIAGWVFYSNTKAMVQAKHSLEHTRIVSQELEHVLSTVQYAQSMQRGFLLTDNNQYLDAYQNAVSQFTREYAFLKTLIKDDPRRQRQVEGIKVLMEARLDGLQKGIELFSSKGFEAARQWVLSGLGGAQMDEIRRRVELLQHEEERLLQERGRKEDADTFAMIETEVTAALFGVMFLSLVFYLLRHETIYRARIEIELERRKRLSDIGTLAATVAHELRNPLAAIRVALPNIEKKASSGLPIKKQLEIIGKMVSESDYIIDNILSYSRIQPPRLENACIYEILEECFDAFKAALKKNIMLEMNIDAIKNIFLQVDPLQIKGVILNLLNNAGDAVADNSGVIKISAEAGNENVKIAIRDNGHGIEKKHLTKVFDPFFTTKSKGTGLGLSVCKQIIDMHGGTIVVESQVNEATVFVVILPKNYIQSFKTAP